MILHKMLVENSARRALYRSGDSLRVQAHDTGRKFAKLKAQAKDLKAGKGSEEDALQTVDSISGGDVQSMHDLSHRRQRDAWFSREQDPTRRAIQMQDDRRTSAVKKRRRMENAAISEEDRAR